MLKGSQRWLGLSVLLMGLACLPPAVRGGETRTFHHENVLGTSLEILVDATSSEVAEKAEASVLAEIDRLSSVFSNYDAKSEFSRWQASAGESWKISPELFRVLEASDAWNKRSGGAFNPAVESLTRLWKKSAKEGHVPTAEALTTAVKQVNQRHWELQADGNAKAITGAPLSLNAIAKGAIIDAAVEKVRRESSGVRAMMVNIGGDLRAAGNLTHPVRIADPRNDAENSQPISTIYLRDKAVATSGGYRRGVDIAGKHYSHIIDPRTGQPTDHVISSTVVAATSADAGPLATTFSVLSVEESERLAATLKGVEYLLVTRDGKMIRSQGWDELEQPKPFRFIAAINADDDDKKKSKEDDKKAEEKKEKPVLLELVVNFELKGTGKGGYKRPYVAVWLENEAEQPVRTSMLWIQEGKGAKWHRDLLRWYRMDKARLKTDDKALIGTISSATRPQGQYKTTFDGLDDHGKALAPGKYTLLIEVAREHGTYQLIRHPLTLGDKPIEETKLKENAEINSASVEYRPHAESTDKSASK